MASDYAKVFIAISHWFIPRVTQRLTSKDEAE